MFLKFNEMRAHKCLVRSITIGNWLGLDWIDVVSTEIVGERLNCEVEVYVHFIWGGAVWRTLLDRRRNEGSQGVGDAAAARSFYYGGVLPGRGETQLRWSMINIKNYEL